MTDTDFTHILRIDGSARREGSVTRELTDLTLNTLAGLGPVQIQTRDLADGVDLISESWVGAAFTDPDARTAAQKAVLELSDALIAEVQAADILVMGLPIYNFGVPGAVKAWIDQIARVGVTFKYTPDGPQGLLRGKRAIVLVASGGTEVGSDIDFATPYIRQALGFIGIDDVTIIAADGIGGGDKTSLTEAKAEIAKLGDTA